MKVKPFAEIFSRGLIVSCQPSHFGDPMDSREVMAAMARTAQDAGAVGIRANGPHHISGIRARTRMPVIGINKIDTPGYDVRITPNFAAVHEIGIHGPQCIAIDGTARPRPGGEDLATLIRRIHEGFGVPVMADVATHEEGVRAAELGADAVATTLSGYTAETMPGGKQPEGPDLELISSLVEALDVPVVAEGRYETPAQMAEAFARGAHAVVIGSAITRPGRIAQRFVEAIPPAK